MSRRPAARSTGPARRLAGVAAAALLVLALAGIVGRAPLILDGLSALLIHIVALAGLLALGAAAARAWRLAAVALLAVAVAGLGAEEARRPAHAAPAAGPLRTLDVAVANVFRFNDHPDAVPALLALDADVLVTVETPHALLAPDGALAQAYPHRRAWSEAWMEWGPVIHSRLPFIDDDPRSRAGQHPVHLLESVDLGGGAAFQVLALHLAKPLTGQAAQFDDFHRFWPSFSSPRLVAGDFNAAPWSAMVRRVEQITRARVIPGWRPTWVGGADGVPRLPRWAGLPIDHLMVSPGVGAEDVRTHAVPGSDHLAVSARLRVPLRPFAGGDGAEGAATQESDADSAASERAQGDAAAD